MRFGQVEYGMSEQVVSGLGWATAANVLGTALASTPDGGMIYVRESYVALWHGRLMLVCVRRVEDGQVLLRHGPIWA